MRASDAEPRLVGPLLMLGLVSMPALFVWLLLRRGYSRSLRGSAFSYAFGPLLLALILNLAVALAG